MRRPAAGAREVWWGGAEWVGSLLDFGAAVKWGAPRLGWGAPAARRLAMGWAVGSGVALKSDPPIF